MTASVSEIPIAEAEWLARYIVRQEHIRKDGTVKPDPFIPYKYVELSVTRHLGLTEHQIWQTGDLVSSQTQGRADTLALTFSRQRLRVNSTPSTQNPNHADVIDWPRDKQAQKEIALEIVKDVHYKPKPVAS